MWSAASVLACALSVLGRAESSLPPIALIAVAPSEVSAHAEAFVRRGDDTIYLITSSPAFRAAAAKRECSSHSLEMIKLASILEHEEWHVRHGPDERAAYERQLTTLIKLGVSPHMNLYRGVQGSMLIATGERKRLPSQRALVRR